MISRRRFLTIAACAVGSGPLRAAPTTWQGFALGAQVSISLRGAPGLADAALAGVRAELERIERLFSLYDPASQISLLNATGRISAPPHEMVELLYLCDRLHRATAGKFDPTVQPLWQAFASGGDVGAAYDVTGWARVSITHRQITLDKGQALTLNGIAQGYATDVIARYLQSHGFADTLVNIGEFSGVGGPWRIGIEDPDYGLVGITELTNRAIATSSPGAMKIGGRGHILNPTRTSGKAQWATVSVEADNAAIADGLSTAFCLMSRQEIGDALRQMPGRPVARLVDRSGDATTLT